MARKRHKPQEISDSVLSEIDKIPAFYFQPDELRALAMKHSKDFLTAEPFPNVVIDDFVPAPILDLVVEDFPTIDGINWQFFGAGARTKEKVGTSDETQFAPFLRHFMGQLNSHTFVQFLENLTQNEGLIVDPSYNNCGLHSTGRRGKLMIHTDLNRHPSKNTGLVHQRYNLILFLNKDWKEKYGGHLELWNREAKRCVKKVLPIFNRCVIFDTGKYSFHGHPEPLTCPEGRRRNSVACYYYQLDRNTGEDYEGIEHKVTWVRTSQDERFGRYAIEQYVKPLVWKVTPPIIMDLYRSIRDRARH